MRVSNKGLYPQRKPPLFRGGPYSSLDHDGHFIDNIVDESVDVEKIVETQMMIEAVRNAISRLNAEEKDIIERLYFNDEAVVLMTRE